MVQLHFCLSEARDENILYHCNYISQIKGYIRFKHWIIQIKILPNSLVEGVNILEKIKAISNAIQGLTLGTAGVNSSQPSFKYDEEYIAVFILTC